MEKKEVIFFRSFLGHEKQSELRFCYPRWMEGENKPIQIWVNSDEEFIDVCEKYDGQLNLYVGLNERKIGGDKDEDIDFITNIGHDIDVHDGNPEGFIKAQEIALKIKDDAIKRGYQESLVICSGRGFWVIHHIIPIKNTEENQKKVKEFGLRIKKKYEVEGLNFDTAVYNPSRIARIPETINVSDKENQIKSFMVNKPMGIEDVQLATDIENIKLPKINYESNGEQPKSSCTFMDYCLTHEVPKGERHLIISRNMSLYIQNHPDRDLLREQYFKIQKGSETELDQWLKSLDNSPEKKYPFSCGQLINFQKKYKIPLKCKGCPKFSEYKKEQKAKKNLLKEVEVQQKAEEIHNPITYFTDKKHLAEQFIKIQPVYYDRSRIWWFWNLKEMRWEICDETDIMNGISDNSQADTVSSKEKNEIIEALKQVSRRQKPMEVKKSWIQFKNTIVDFETGEEFPTSPKYFITNPIPYKLDEDRFSDTPTVDRIFEEWVGEKYVKTLYEIIAYSLIPNYPLHRIFCFIGSGMNGKSKYLELLRKFIGNENCCSTELDTLLNSKFEVFRLYKKLVCQMGETNFNEMNKTSILKKLSGEDLIGFEKKRCDPFEDNNYAKIIISTNNLPTTSDKTIGFYRRWLIIDFPNQFSEKKDILADIPEEEYECLAVKCLIVLKELMERRSFHNEGSIEDRMKRYEDKSNPFDKFFNEFIIEDFNEFVTKASFKHKLNEWCKANKFREMSDQAINIKMKEKHFHLDERDYMDWYEGGKLEKKLVRSWKGIKFNEVCN